MMSGLGFDYIVKKIALFLVEFSLIISALFVGEKLIIEYITKKIVKGFYSNFYLNFKLSKYSMSFFLTQIVLIIIICINLLLLTKLLQTIII